MAALTITPASVLVVAGSLTSNVVAGGTITAGMAVYMDAADSNKYKPARANALATAACNGIALHGASNGQPLAIAVADGVNINPGASNLLRGLTYAVSDAVAGEIVPTADLATTDYVSIIGTATSTANLVLNIYNSGVAIV